MIRRPRHAWVIDGGPETDNAVAVVRAAGLDPNDVPAEEGTPCRMCAWQTVADGAVARHSYEMQPDQRDGFYGHTCLHCGHFQPDRPSDGTRVHGPWLPDVWPPFVWPEEIRAATWSIIHPEGTHSD